MMIARSALVAGQRLLATSAQQKPSRCFLSSIKRIGVENPNMSQIVVHNGTVYMSGQVDKTLPEIEGQTKIVLAKIEDLLEQAGTSKSNLLTATIWLKDIDRDFQAFNSVWVDWIDSENKPVRATVQSPMASPPFLVEIQVTAAAGL